MEKHLFTGGWLLNDPNDNHLLGATMGCCLPKEHGIVRVCLNGRTLPWEPDNDISLQDNEIRWQSDGEQLYLDIPEQIALEIARQLVMMANRLEHLRGLLKLHQLTPDCLYPHEETIES